MFSGVGDAIQTGSQATNAKTVKAMRTKELLGSALVLGTGAFFSIRDKTWWPILVAVGVIVLVVVLHEFHANKNTPEPDNLLTIGPFK